VYLAAQTTLECTRQAACYHPRRRCSFQRSCRSQQRRRRRRCSAKKQLTRPHCCVQYHSASVIVALSTLISPREKVVHSRAPAVKQRKVKETLECATQETSYKACAQSGRLSARCQPTFQQQKSKHKPKKLPPKCIANRQQRSKVGKVSGVP